MVKLWFQVGVLVAALAGAMVERWPFYSHDFGRKRQVGWCRMSFWQSGSMTTQRMHDIKALQGSIRILRGIMRFKVQGSGLGLQKGWYVLVVSV